MPERWPEAQRRRLNLAPGLVMGLACLVVSAHAADLTGRVSVLGTAAWPGAGDVGDGVPGISVPSADQQGLRLMLEDHGGGAEWSVHAVATRQNFRGVPASTAHSSDLFRFRRLAAESTSGDGVRRQTRLDWALERIAYKKRFGATSLSVGRQPIDWGAGRFWQPLNVFGAFAPTALDTDYKPGIDAAVFNWYPSDFSSLTAVYALAPHDDRTIKNSGALHYQRQVGQTSQFALLAGEVIGQRQLGASFESDWRGIGWRIEALHTQAKQTGGNTLFWIAGVDYQFDKGTLVSAEWYHNGRGASSEADLPVLLTDRLVTSGLQPQLSQRVLGLSVQQDITPLISASYTLLATPLKDAAGSYHSSLLHQLSLVYSLSNESDLLLSMSLGTGKGLDAQARPRSEFGATPTNATLRWRHYF